MLLKVNKSNFLGMSDRPVGYINPDYIVAIYKSDVDATVYMTDGHTYPIDLESFDRLIKLKSITEKDEKQMLIEDCKTMFKEKQDEEKVIYKIPVGDIPEDVKKEKLDKLRKELKEKQNNEEWEIINE